MTEETKPSPAESKAPPTPKAPPSPPPKPPEPAKPKKRKGGFFQKIPEGFLFSPGGVILVFTAIAFEISDFLIPDWLIASILISSIIEIIPDLIFAFLLYVIAGISFKASIIPFLIERIPIINEILPTWVIRMFM